MYLPFHFSFPLLFLTIFICFAKILMWLLEIIASVNFSILGCPFSLLATACLFAITPAFRIWQLLFVHPENFFNFMRMHATNIISPFPESSMCLFFALQNPDIIPLHVHCCIKPLSKWMFSQSCICIPCRFKLFKLLHLLIVKSSFFCGAFVCFCPS